MEASSTTQADAGAEILRRAPALEIEFGSDGGVAHVARNLRRDSYLRRLLAGADVLAFSVALLALGALGLASFEPTVALAPLVLVVVAKLIGLYDRDAHLTHKTTLEEVPAIFSLSAISVLGIFLAGSTFTADGVLSSSAGSVLLLTLFVLTISLRAGARRLWRETVAPERCLLVGDTQREHALRDALEFSDAAHVTLVGSVPVLGDMAQSDPSHLSAELIQSLAVDRVIVAPGDHGSDQLMFVIRALRDAGVKVSLIPDVSRLAGSSVEVDAVAGITLLGMRRFAITTSSRAIKRTFDLVASSLLLLLLSPLLAAVAFAIRFSQPGSPILYRQRRIGRHGAPFEILKFRTMDEGSHERRDELSDLDEGALGFFKIPDDPRVTRVGRRLRRTNLDELPQLLNVLRGEMSLVGPRPLIPEEDRQVAGSYRRRLDVRPGITGHWQVLGSARVPMAEMVKLDYLYVSNWSLWGDLLLIARTIPLIARRRGL